MSKPDVIDTAAADAADAAQVTLVPVEQIRPALDNPRGDLGDLTDLANSIKSIGVLQPILVTPRPEDGLPPYLCVIGHRRHAATVKAGRTHIPAIIRDLTEVDRLTAMHVENVQREDLKPTEEAKSLKALSDLGLSQRQIVAKVGKSQAYISKRLSLLGLPDEVQAELDAGRLTVGDGIELARLKSDADIRTIVKAAQRTTGDKTVFYEGIARMVANLLAKADRDKQVARVTRTLRAEGVTVVDYPPGGIFGGTGIGKRIGTGFGQVDVDPEGHAAEPCHAAAVTPDAEVVYVCTEPDRHKADPGGEGGEPGAQGRVADNGGSEEEIAAERERAEVEAWAEYAERERARERAELAAAAERRRAFIADLVRGKPNRNDVLTLILTDYLALSDDWTERVLPWLGIEVEEDTDHYHVLTTYAGQSLANLTRAALAILLDRGESLIGDAGFVAFLDGDVRRHFAFLTANGYEPSEAEQRNLTPPTPQPEPDQEPEPDAQPEPEDGSGQPTETEPDSEPAPADAEPVEAEGEPIEAEPSEGDAA